jgi:hypothetical protein
MILSKFLADMSDRMTGALQKFDPPMKLLQLQRQQHPQPNP